MASRTGRVGVKLLLDEQLSGKVAEALRRRGRDVTAVAETPSLRGLGDRDVFQIAQEEQRAVVTYNVGDFIAIVREFAQAELPHRGLVLVSSSRLPNSDFGRLTAALEAFLEDAPGEESLMTWLQPPAR